MQGAESVLEPRGRESRDCTTHTVGAMHPGLWAGRCYTKGTAGPLALSLCISGAPLMQGTSSIGARETGKHQIPGASSPGAIITFGHDLMHGNREEEDRVAVVGPGACTEVLLHGLHDRKQLVRQHGDIMEDDLQQGTRKPQE